MFSGAKEEFQRQVETLVEKGYPAAYGLSETGFRDSLGALIASVPGAPSPLDCDHGTVPFCIVIPAGLAPAEWMMSRTERHGKPGHTALTPFSSADFTVIEEVRVPVGPAYLILGVDRGSETRKVTPETALGRIRDRGRFPLTIDEGIAILTHHPEFLRKNNGFSLLASRRNDQRVPAIWLDGRRNPKLGWCWDRNPHTWLGSASCERRSGTTDAAVEVDHPSG